MGHMAKLKMCAAVVIGAGVLGGCQGHRPGGVSLGYDLADQPRLSEAEVRDILDQAERAARQEPSLLRRDGQGGKLTTRMHIIVVDRRGAVLGRRSMDDAWAGSVDIARSKAFTAMAFSSDANALSSRSIGALTQPGGALWNIGNSNPMHGLIEFPGGLPLYEQGQLVGGIGVSGDGVEQDENVAEAGATGYEPAEAIRIDTVTHGGVPYVK